MKLSTSVISLLSLAVAIVASAAEAEYEFYCGAYGGGEIKIESGMMSFEVDLENLDSIVDNVGDTLGYHLHTTWVSAVASSTSQCGPDITGGHYDPTLKCGPASEAIDSIQCTNNGNSDYQCSSSHPNKCERGDLSGKYGGLVVLDDYTATKTYSDDRQGATMQDFVEDNTVKDHARWSSIVFHDLAKGGERVLCCKIVEEMESMD